MYDASSNTKHAGQVQPGRDVTDTPEEAKSEQNSQMNEELRKDMQTLFNSTSSLSGQPSGGASFGQQPSVSKPCVNRVMGGSGDIGFFGGNYDSMTIEMKQLTTNEPGMEQSQKNSNENNQLFAKILENEMFNIPMHLKLDCMQEMLGVVKKYTSISKRL